ncbi:Cloroperoxidase [Hyaloscypha variabilis F]|uniref:Cloroperoxidase n=1 Tax=Hyaloscypha variabilis (strain UAMH 11265 / GT02V1 / F) TaxID=1149755 RepID=A0A2J6RM72_HYAVF|nr:Cloroperoxidase [Hyaloscypha variabilis F]
MKLSILSTTLAIAFANAQGSLEGWTPAGPTDLRGPCPMMNTLANHGFLPHDGGNITKENAVHALTTAINFNTSLATLMWEQALIANPEPNATFFTLDNLNRHNVLEHDASMSRSDAFFGNNHIFNQSIFDTTRAYWTADTLTADMLANGKIARQLASKSTNPEYSFTTTNEAFSLGEVAAPIIVFGDMATATVNKSFVEFFFENEKLPSKLGWTKQADVVQLADTARIAAIINNATSLITPIAPIAAAAKRRDLHSVW